MTEEQYGPFIVERFTDDRGREAVRVTGTETGRVGEYPAGMFDFTVEARGIEHACRSVLSSAEHSRDAAMDHLFHVWINGRNQHRMGSDEWERDLYEWKTAIGEMKRLPGWLRKARTGALPTQHRQCSHSAIEEIPNNRLVCALGRDVAQCPILATWYATWNLERERTLPDGRASYYADQTSADDGDEVAARICAWHIFMEKLRRPFLDTSEGYVQDEGDRMFWDRTYSNMMALDEDSS